MAMEMAAVLIPEAMLMVTNLSADSLETLELALAPQWRGRRVLRLDADGRWQPADAAEACGRLRVSGMEMHYLKPAILRLA